VDQLLDYLDMPTQWTILDPAAGRGNIVDACRAKGHSVIGSDLVYRGRPEFKTRDFLQGHNEGGYAPSSVDAVICNPPFFSSKGVVDFTERAMQVATKLVAMLAPVTFLGSQGRREHFRNAQGLQILYLSTRPSMPPGHTLKLGEEGKGGKRDYLWLVYRIGKPSQPVWWL
jgi:hypothetical protein